MARNKIGIAGLLALFLVSFSASAVEVFPIEDFTKKSQIQNVRISPTGDYLATTVPLENRTNLIVLDRKTLKPINSFKFGKNEHVYSFFWATDKRLVIRTAFRYGSLSDWDLASGDIFASDFDGTNDRFIYGPRARGKSKKFKFASILDRLPADKDHILIESRTHVSHSKTKSAKSVVHKLNIHNGRLKQQAVSPIHNAQLLTDNEGRVRVAVGGDEEYNVVVMYRADESSEWKTIDTYAYGEGGITPLAFTGEGNRFAIKSTKENTIPGLYMYDPDLGEKKLVYRHDFVDFSPLWQFNEEKEFDEIVGTVVMPDRIRKNYFDSMTSALDMSLDQLFPDSYVRVTSRSKDKRYQVVNVISDSNPGEFYLFDKEKSTMSYIASRRPWVDPKTMATQKPIEIKARDGLVLRGYLTIPKGAKAENLPMVVHPHGGPHGPRDQWFYNPDVQLLANRGYAVLQINFRGSGGYGLDFENAGHGEWGGIMQDDLTDATHWAINEGIADKDRICIYGASYGGYASLMGVVKEPDLYKCAVGHVGVYDLEFMKTKGNVAERLLGGSAYMDMVMGTDPEQLKKISPAHNVEAIKAAVMIVHGGQDLQAHYENAHILRRAMDKAGKPYEWLFYPKEGHGFQNEKNRLEFREKLLAFLEANIGK